MPVIYSYSTNLVFIQVQSQGRALKPWLICNGQMNGQIYPYLQELRVSIQDARDGLSQDIGVMVCLEHRTVSPITLLSCVCYEGYRLVCMPPFDARRCRTAGRGVVSVPRPTGIWHDDNSRGLPPPPSLCPLLEHLVDVAWRRHVSEEEIPEITRRPAPSSGSIPACENPGVTRRGIEPDYFIPGLTPGRVAPGFSQVRTMPDDTAGRRVISGISSFPAPVFRRSPVSGTPEFRHCTILTLFHPHQLSRARPNLYTYICTSYRLLYTAHPLVRSDHCPPRARKHVFIIAWLVFCVDHSASPHRGEAGLAHGLTAAFRLPIPTSRCKETEFCPRQLERPSVTSGGGEIGKRSRTPAEDISDSRRAAPKENQLDSREETIPQLTASLPQTISSPSAGSVWMCVPSTTAPPAPVRLPLKLVGGFSRGSPVLLVPSFRRCSITTSLYPHQISRLPISLRSFQNNFDKIAIHRIKFSEHAALPAGAFDKHLLNSTSERGRNFTLREEVGIRGYTHPSRRSGSISADHQQGESFHRATSCKHFTGVAAHHLGTCDGSWRYACVHQYHIQSASKVESVIVASFTLLLTRLCFTIFGRPNWRDNYPLMRRRQRAGSSPGQLSLGIEPEPLAWRSSRRRSLGRPSGVGWIKMTASLQSSRYLYGTA
ncbi:hypothetical protein PR048_015128 [Dryococelus australis]|uniref:Uncharacterized protein n=1 Tax=Dryococelus australis TaxID=614101 RepID=A0ABQ9HGC5_9NEOP|nr:hypothetical protein PR048_015128 [Dryococelus australis]